jgi:hypothetical protein
MCEPDTTLSVKYEPQFRAAPLQIDQRHIGLSQRRDVGAR